MSKWELLSTELIFSNPLSGQQLLRVQLLLSLFVSRWKLLSPEFIFSCNVSRRQLLSLELLVSTPLSQ